MEKKVTKVQRFNDIINLLEEKTPFNGTTIEEAVSFIENEIALIKKKNATKTSKETKAKEQSDEYRALIIDFLSEQSEGVTCTEIARAIPELNDFNNQKISALLRPITYSEEKNPEGVVTKTIEKGKSLFTIR